MTYNLPQALKRTKVYRLGLKLLFASMEMKHSSNFQVSTMLPKNFSPVGVLGARVITRPAWTPPKGKKLRAKPHNFLL